MYNLDNCLNNFSDKELKEYYEELEADAYINSPENYERDLL